MGGGGRTAIVPVDRQSHRAGVHGQPKTASLGGGRPTPRATGTKLRALDRERRQKSHSAANNVHWRTGGLDTVTGTDSAALYHAGSTPTSKEASVKTNGKLRHLLPRTAGSAEAADNPDTDTERKGRYLQRRRPRPSDATSNSLRTIAANYSYQTLLKRNPSKSETELLCFILFKFPSINSANH